MAGLTLATIGMGLAAAAMSEPPQREMNLAYDRPLADSLRRSIVDITVVDAATKTPVVGAEVFVLSYIDFKYRVISTDQKGQLRVVYPHPGRPSLNIEVRKDGYVPQRSSWYPGSRKEGSPRRVTIGLRRGIPIGGLVTDEEGQPIEGVTVVATVDEHGPGERLTDDLGYEIFYEVPLRTGPDGRWQTRSLPATASKVSLQLIHPDYVSGNTRTLGGPGLRRPTIAALRDRTDRQVMTRGVRLGGRVVDAAGKPIPNARIVESSRGLTVLDYLREAETDAEGRFRFHLEPKEKVKLTVQVKGYEPLTRSFEARDATHPIELRLEPGKVVLGRVVDPAGKPIPAVSVMVSSLSRNKELFLQTWTDSTGRFRWDSAPAGQVELSVGTEEYLWLENVPFTADGQEKVVVLKPGLTVTIKTRDSRTGLPIKSFSIETGIQVPGTDDFRWEPGLTRAVTDGEYRTALDARVGPYQFRVKSDGYVPVTSRAVRGDEKSVEEVIELERPAP
jgi:hypothetical protein